MLNVNDTPIVSKTVSDYMKSRYIPHTVSNKIYQIKIQDLDEIVNNLTFNSNYVNSGSLDGTDLLRKVIKVLYDAKDIPIASTIVIVIPNKLQGEYNNYMNLDYDLVNYGVYITQDTISAFGDEDTSSLDFAWVLYTDDIKDLEDFNAKKLKYKQDHNINSVKEPSAVYCEKAIEYADIKRIQGILESTVTSLWFVCQHYSLYEEANETVETAKRMEEEGDLSVLTLKDLVVKEKSLFSVSMVDYFEVGWEFLQQLLKDNKNILLVSCPLNESNLDLDLPSAISAFDREISHNSIKVLYTTMAIYSVMTGNSVVVERYESLFNQLISLVNNLDKLPIYYRIQNKRFDEFMFMYSNTAQLCRLVKLDNITESLTLKEFNYDEVITAYYKDDLIKPNSVTRDITDIEVLNTIDFLCEESKKYENVSLSGNVINNNSDFKGADNIVKLVIGALSQYVLNFENIANLRDIIVYKVKGSDRIKIALSDYSMSVDVVGYHTSALSVKEGKLVQYATTLNMDTTETLYRLNLCSDYKEFIKDLGIVDCDIQENLKPIIYTDETLKLIFNYVIGSFENRKGYSVFSLDNPRDYLLGKLFRNTEDFEKYLLPILRSFTSLKHIYKTGLVDAFKRVQALGKDDKIIVNEKFFGSKYSISEQLK